MSISKQLRNILDSYSMDDYQDLDYLTHEIKASISRILKKEYGSKVVAAPVLSGSLVKGTAINTHFDLDLVIPFSRYAFRTPAHMLEDLYAFFDEEVTLNKPLELVEVYDQRVSVGLLLEDLETNWEIDVDLVPGLERSLGDYQLSKDLILWDSEKEKSILTNISRQVNSVHSQGNGYPDLVKLMKIWRNDYGDEMRMLKSFVLEMAIQKAFQELPGLRKGPLWERLKMTLLYFRDKFPGAQLPDPGNPHNLVNGLLEREDWDFIAEKAEETLQDIEEDPDELTRYFPYNEE